jgi:amidase
MPNRRTDWYYIHRPFEEDKLLKIGYAFEQGTKARKLPKDYK